MTRKRRNRRPNEGRRETSVAGRSSWWKVRVAKRKEREEEVALEGKRKRKKVKKMKKCG